MSDDFTIPLPASIEAPNAMPLDEAVAIACAKLGLPILGGPSGSGWSLYSVAQRCPHLFKRSYVDVPTENVTAAHEMRAPAAPLQIGALYHTLQAFFYACGLGECIEHERGLIASNLKPKLRGRPKKHTIPNNAADLLLAELRTMADALVDLEAAANGGKVAAKKPSAALIYEAERCFDAHTAFYADKEDLEPLAIEWKAENEELRYTCRYDAIFRVGPQHPLVYSGSPIQAGSTVVYERKTSAYLSEMAKDGWFLDGEILGELLNWKPSGCEKLFGPLAGVVVDIVTKAKTPAFHQVIVPTTLPTVAEHERWIRYTQGEMAMWQASGTYPKRLTQCFDRWGRCGNWHACAAGEGAR